MDRKVRQEPRGSQRSSTENYLIRHSQITDAELRKRIHQKEIILAGNAKLAIYGTLHCQSGKRMKKENRVFFHSENEALQNRFRPCGHCLGEQYKKWKMDLFNTERTTNLLPYDGTVNYYGKVLPQTDANHYLARLLENIEWKNDEAIIFGRHIITKRKVAWYGDTDYRYTYSNTTKQALAWTEELKALKQLTEQTTGATFNSCLLNLYHDGEEGMAWHSDDEKSLGRDSTIASFSFGAERKFSFKHKKTGDTHSVLLENGSLLAMKGTTQTHWLHSLPKSKKVKHPRINLTFRTMLG